MAMKGRNNSLTLTKSCHVPASISPRIIRRKSSRRHPRTCHETEKKAAQKTLCCNQIRGQGRPCRQPQAPERTPHSEKWLACPPGHEGSKSVAPFIGDISTGRLSPKSSQYTTDLKLKTLPRSAGRDRASPSRYRCRRRGGL